MDLRDPDKLTWFCRKDDTTFATQRVQGTSRPVPPVGEFEVWIPVLWLVAIILLGYYLGLLGIVVLICATIYVHYNSKKFGIGGSKALITLLFAVIGLPLYAYDLHELRGRQASQPETDHLISAPAVRPAEPVTVLTEQTVATPSRHKARNLLLFALLCVIPLLILANY
jgi:hypothetical protein